MRSGVSLKLPSFPSYIETKDNHLWPDLGKGNRLLHRANSIQRPDMTADRPIVFVLDDDARVREALTNLLASVGFEVKAFGLAAEFLGHEMPDSPACLILDLQLPDIGGLDLQRQLAASQGPPIVFISGHGDIPTSVSAIKGGAIEFLPKPFSAEDLLQAVNSAIEHDKAMRQKNAELAALQAHYQHLTPREKEVLPLVVSGLLNKQAAGELGISETTLQIHRSSIMRKMAAGSLAELVKMALKLGISEN
jgi:FixJ family two-component response regulator